MKALRRQQNTTAARDEVVAVALHEHNLTYIATKQWSRRFSDTVIQNPRELSTTETHLLSQRHPPSSVSEALYQVTTRPRRAVGLN